MRITQTTRLVNHRVPEKSAFNVIASFWDDSTDTWATNVPTTVRYRIDDPYLDREVLGWTTVTPAAEVTVSITSSQNAILNNANKEERRQITFQANNGLTTQYSDTSQYFIQNLSGQT